ncbi:DUF5049 domain-containing protein [Clostridium tyrobutyricum]|nr:DUF5049 domain-containing protein [Clostridium tyrobutyricum]MBR9648605.1 DUF5049 domain-containing protein [Clostridium tyrobutyricum]
MSEKIAVQILSIREDGKYNMFDIVNIQKEAYNRKFYELVCFLEEHEQEYSNFILTGQK